VVAALLVLGTAGCRAPAPVVPVDDAEATVPEPSAPAAIVEEPTSPLAPVDPFEIVLITRGGRSTNPVYDFTVRSDGKTTLRYLKYKKGTQSLFDDRAPAQAIEELRDVLAVSRLRHEEGEYGGDAGSRNSSRFHVSSLAIDVSTPTERRRITFPRPYAWKEYSADNQRVFLEFLDLWRAAEACLLDVEAPRSWYATDEQIEAVWTAVHEGERTRR